MTNRPDRYRYEDLIAATWTDAIRAKLDAMGLIEFFGLEECLQMLSSKLAIPTSQP